MSDRTYKEIDEVINYIHKNLYEPLSLSQLSKHISYSPYHFTRIFKERMGLSPLYYVSAVRLQKAKELLLSTELTVRDIALEIGQQSLGTFTSRFAERIGVTPVQFRTSKLKVDTQLADLQHLNTWTSFTPEISFNSVKGTVHAATAINGFILIGLFSKPIPEGLPHYGTWLSSLGDFSFTNIKPGTYFLMATTLSWGMGSNDILLPENNLRFRQKEPILVKPGSIVPHQHVTLHAPRIDDPPILISLPLLMDNYLNRLKKK